jgi:hypothetical protein
MMRPFRVDTAVAGDWFVRVVVDCCQPFRLWRLALTDRFLRAVHFAAITSLSGVNKHACIRARVLLINIPRQHHNTDQITLTCDISAAIFTH